MKILLALAAAALLYVAAAFFAVRWGWRASAGLDSFALRCVVRAALLSAFTAPSFLLGGERGFPVPALVGLCVGVVTLDSYAILPALKWLGAFWAGWTPVVALVSYLRR